MANNKYVLGSAWLILTKEFQLPVQDMLRIAKLPLDLLTRKPPTVTAEEYFRLWTAIDIVTRDRPLFPLELGSSITPEAFSPEIFACFCSENMNMAMNRLSYYKPLVGPIRLDVQQTPQQTTFSVKGLPNSTNEIPHSFMAMELVFIVRVARLGTREHIVPMAVTTTIDIPEKAAYEEWLGVPITKGTYNGVTLHARDAARPFLTASEQMWDIFEPQLNMRMADLQQESSFRDKVRACLMEILASGHYSMSDVARRLAVSTRTLQRRLKSENTTFQKELDTLREELARNYLKKSDYTSGQIAFLLGYEDPNSFFRAFRAWTGETPEVVRASIQ